jgi:adenine-specific DNA-methyltransferase
VVEFLGSKRRLSGFIVKHIAAHVSSGARVADLFSGTAAVSSALREHGFAVVAIDHLALCSTFAEAVLLNDGVPPFAAAGEVTKVFGDRRYEGILSHLNALSGREGFVHQNYSPAAAKTGGFPRQYFTAANAAKIDAVRCEIDRLSPLLSRGERGLLLADLVRAVSAVSNTAGTYGCFLKTWKARALEPLQLRASPKLLSGRTDHEVHCADAADAAANVQVDAVYADPPYTKRQYAAYYHVLETVVRNDEPVVTGKTGLRHWQDQKSEFCYKKRAAAALVRLVSSVECGHFFLSYSDDGHLRDIEIRSILSGFGKVKVGGERPYRRYRSSGLEHRRSSVMERLYCLQLA